MLTTAILMAYLWAGKGEVGSNTVLGASKTTWMITQSGSCALGPIW